MVNDFGGGPRAWKFAWVINFQKTGTFPFLAVLIAWYHNTSTAAWIYLAMHGSYGLVWIIKDLAFPDPAWQRRITIGGGINAFLSVLGWYWVFGWLLISGTSKPAYPLPDHAWFCLCISLCILGSVIMIAADAQKYFTLRVRRGLITDGMYRYIRHPNYLGEMMIYGSFALMVWHWLPVVVLAWVWGGLFAVNMTTRRPACRATPNGRNTSDAPGGCCPRSCNKAPFGSIGLRFAPIPNIGENHEHFDEQGRRQQHGRQQRH